MNKVRIGIIGMGIQGTNYARLLSESDCPEHAQLAGYCDIDQEALDKANRDFGEKPSYADYRDLIRSGEVDAVITTVPHYLHPEMAIYALEQGVHPLIEKPAGIDAKSVRQMNEVAAEHPELVFGIMLNQRTNRLYIKLKEIIDTGELGELRRANWIINTWWRSTSYYKQSEWRATWGAEGGGVLVNQAPHQLDLFQWLCGVPETVYAKMRFGAYRDIVVENDVTMVTTYPNGATGVFVSATHDPLGTDRLEIDFSKGKIVVEGSKTAKVMRFNKDESELDRTMTPQQIHEMVQANAAGDDKLATTETITDDGRWGNQHRVVIDRFCRQIVEGEGLLADGDEGIMGVQLANAAYLSAWTGEEVTLPVDEARFLEELNKQIAAEGKYPLREVE